MSDRRIDPRVGVGKTAASLHKAFQPLSPLQPACFVVEAFLRSFGP